MRALDGVRVLDLSRFIAGPMCAMLLGDLGADVIKVERPGGEDARFSEPTYSEKSIYTALYNRNKRGITVNARVPEGRDLLRKLVAVSDVVVENFRPGTMDKIGLSYKELREVRSDIILVSISGFGEYGEFRDRVLFDCIAQAMSGLMYMNGEGDGPPQLTKMMPADTLTAVYGALGTMAALLHRARTGEGQCVDLAVFDSLVSALGNPLPTYAATGATPARLGNSDETNAPGGLFEAVDGYVYMHAGTPAFWERLCREVLRAPELLERDDLGSGSQRMQHREELEKIVASWVSRRSVHDVEPACARAGIPCAVVADIPAAVENVHRAGRGMLVELKDGDGDTAYVLGNPLKLTVTPPDIRLPPPNVGQHTAEVLTTILGMSLDEVDRLKLAGAL